MQPGLPTLSQGDLGWRPVLVSGVFNGYPGIQFSDGNSLGVQSLGMTGADFTLFVLGRSLSEQSPGSGPGATGRRFLFQQTLTRNIQGDTRPFVVGVSVGSNGMALYELDLDDVPRAIIPADMSVFCPLTIGYRESLPLASLCSQSLVQPSVVTGYQLGVAPGTGNGFDGMVAEVLLYQGILSDSDRLTVEQYLEDKYQCCNSSSSSSSDSSDSSSSDSSSSDSSDSSSSESSDSSSSESSESSSSSCSCELPSDPTPVTDGLVAWFRSDTNVASFENLVNVWGGVCECYPNAVSIGSTPPGVSDSSFGSYPGLTFDGGQSLQIQAGELAQDSFTIFIIGHATGDRVAGGAGISGQRLLLSQSGDGSNAWPSISAGQSSIGIYEYGPTNAARADYSGDTGDTEVLCPLVVRYDNRQLSIWLRSELVYQDTATPAYALWLAHYLGGTGDADSGFIGALAEILFYNRALTDSEREAVESYLQTRYGCMPSSSDSGESSDSSDSSDSESSDSSSSESSSSSSSESSSSEESDHSDSSSESSLEITTTELPVGIVDSDYRDESGGTVSVTAEGGVGSYTFSCDESTLPPGLSLGSDGVLSGTPTEEGDFWINVTVEDSAAEDSDAEENNTDNADIECKVTAFQITGPEKIGVVTELSKATAQVYTVTVPDGKDPNKVILQQVLIDADQRRVNVTAKEPIGNTRTFEVAGIRQSENEQDVLLRLVYDGQPLAQPIKQLSVVVPYKFSDLPNPAQVVVPETISLTRYSSPSFEFTNLLQAQGVWCYLVTWWGTTLSISVLDQFGDDIGNLYNGTEIFEQFAPIGGELGGKVSLNQRLYNGVYSDPSGLYDPGVGNNGYENQTDPYPTDEQWINENAPSPTPLDAAQTQWAAQQSGSRTDIIQVWVGPFPMEITITRTQTLTPENNLVITHQ